MTYLIILLLKLFQQDFSFQIFYKYFVMIPFLTLIIYIIIAYLYLKAIDYFFHLACSVYTQIRRVIRML